MPLIDSFDFNELKTVSLLGRKQRYHSYIYGTMHFMHFVLFHTQAPILPVAPIYNTRNRNIGRPRTR